MGGEGQRGGRLIALTRWRHICFEVPESKANSLPCESEALRPTSVPVLPWSDLLHLHRSLWIPSMPLKVREFREPRGAAPAKVSLVVGG